jgi:hypothetical protein
MQKHTTFRSQSTRNKENGGSQKHSQPTQTDTTSPKWYQSITELPLSKFIEVAVDGNYAALIKSGFPSESQLHEAWFGIYQEYIDAMGDNNQAMIMRLYSEITQLSITLAQVQSLIDILSVYKYKKFEAQLNKLLASNFAFDKTRAQDLQKCDRLAKGIGLKVTIKTAQLESITKKNEVGDTKVSREYFQSVLITLSDFSKYDINDSITTFQFCERVRRFGTYLQSKKNKP